jgi:hypothetical protein
MMSLYSYKNQEPEKLPKRVRLDDGSTRTNLKELSIEELESYGFSGPFVKPEFDKDTQRIEWTGNSYEIIRLPEEEIIKIAAEKERKKRSIELEYISYERFWELLITSRVYIKLRAAASQSLAANVFFTELFSIFRDARFGKPNDEIIQKYINILLLDFEFTENEIKELQEFMDDANLNVQYTLPDAEYLSSHVYDSETNEILVAAPFDSWTIVNGEWKAPINYPTDGKIYNWDEDIKNWVVL